MFELAQLYNRVNRNSLEQITNSLFPPKLRTTIRFYKIIYELPVEQIACSFSRLLKAYWSKNHVPFVFFSSYLRKASKCCPSPRRESHSSVSAVYVHTKGGIFTQILQFVYTECLFGFRIFALDLLIIKIGQSVHKKSLSCCQRLFCGINIYSVQRSRKKTFHSPIPPYYP